jgi:hypothetical protein
MMNKFVIEVVDKVIAVARLIKEVNCGRKFHRFTRNCGITRFKRILINAAGGVALSVAFLPENMSFYLQTQAEVIFLLISQNRVSSGDFFMELCFCRKVIDLISFGHWNAGLRYKLVAALVLTYGKPI